QLCQPLLDGFLRAVDTLQGLLGEALHLAAQLGDSVFDLLRRNLLGFVVAHRSPPGSLRGVTNSLGGQGPLRRRRIPTQPPAVRREARNFSRFSRGTRANQRWVLRSWRPRHSRTESAVTVLSLVSTAATRPTASWRRFRYSRPVTGLAVSASLSS